MIQSDPSRSSSLADAVGAAGAIALVLALVGIYGVIAYRVSQRTREIGVRLALGARRADILALVLRQGVGLTLAGVSLGLIASFWLSRFLQGMLFRVTTTDAMTYVGVSALLAATALVSNLLPARRAVNVDPVSAMRAE